MQRRTFFREAGEYETARDYYELVAESVPDQATAAFKAGLASLALGDVAAALDWYHEGLARTAEGDEEQALAAMKARLQLELRAPDLGAGAGAALALFEEAGVRLEAASPEATFALGLETLEVAMNTVRAGAHDLRDYFLAHPEIDWAAAYWPLHDSSLARRRAVSRLKRSDRYWRYRAEFGFNLLADRALIRQYPDDAELYDEIFQVVIEDVKRAYALNREEHQTWRDFFVDANIGWIYMKLGNDYAREGAYEEALATYAEAASRIQPESRNAALDLTDAYFGAGLTALRLEPYAEADEWYEGGIDLVRRYGTEFNLGLKIGPAIEALDELLAENPELAAIGQTIRQELEDLPK